MGFLYFDVWLVNFPKDTEDESELQGVAEDTRKSQKRLHILDCVKHCLVDSLRWFRAGGYSYAQ